MPSGSLPIWVTLLVAGMGIVGLVAAQGVNAWREGRRMKREHEREDVRWNREAAEREAQREHDARMQWREHRAKIYGEFLAAFNAFIDAARDRAFRIIRGETAKRLDDSDYSILERLAGQILTTSAAVDLAGTPAVRQAAEAVITACGAARMELRPEVRPEEVDVNLPYLYEARSTFLDHVRNELVVGGNAT